LFAEVDSVDGFNPFNFFNSDIFDVWQRSPEDSPTFNSRGLASVLPLSCHLLLRVSRRAETVGGDDGGIPLVHRIGAAGILGLDGTG
jgi:hypothetical protein